MPHLFQGVHYDVDERVYHSDPCPKPSLSVSIAKEVWQNSPLHAWVKHPRLNPDFEPEQKRQFDLGNLAHYIFLEPTYDKVEIIYADNYRTKKAQEVRQQAYNDNRIPALAHEVEGAVEMVDVAHEFIDNTEIQGIFEYPGESEVTIIEFSDGFWKRCRIDWLPWRGNVILDYKTTAGSSKPQTWMRTNLWPMNLDIQAYTYPHILSLVEKIEPPKFVFLVQETKKPYACSLIGASPAMIASGKKKWEYAVHKWKYCLEHNKWPGHDNRIHWAEPPVWQMMEVEERGDDVVHV